MNKHKLTSEEQITLDYYDQKAEDWSGKHKGGLFDEDYERLFNLLPTGKILEIGSGQGYDAKTLIKHYGINNYVGCDASVGLLGVARKNNPGARFEHVSIYDIGELNKKFDGFWVSAMLIHLPKSRLNEALNILHQNIKMGGFGFVSIMEGDSDMQQSRPGRYYSLWNQKEFEVELHKAGFEVVNKRKIETDASPWLAYILKVS